MSNPVGARGPRLRAWNLLLLVPFLMLVTPWFNAVQPRLFGLPFFYWAQFAFVPIGVVCVAIVHVTTRTGSNAAASGPGGDLDSPDEGRANR